MRRSDTVIEVLLAWAVGLLLAGLASGPVIALSQGAGWDGILRGVTKTPTHLALSFSLGAMISVPLIVLGIGAALILGPGVVVRPVAWAAGSAIVGAVVFALGDMLVRGMSCRRRAIR